MQKMGGGWFNPNHICDNFEIFKGRKKEGWGGQRIFGILQEFNHFGWGPCPYSWFASIWSLATCIELSFSSLTSDLTFILRCTCVHSAPIPAICQTKDFVQNYENQDTTFMLNFTESEGDHLSLYSYSYFSLFFRFTIPFSYLSLPLLSKKYFFPQENQFKASVANAENV